jgi:hypothetical protein
VQHFALGYEEGRKLLIDYVQPDTTNTDRSLAMQSSQVAGVGDRSFRLPRLRRSRRIAVYISHSSPDRTPRSPAAPRSMSFSFRPVRSAGKPKVGHGSDRLVNRTPRWFAGAGNW